MLHATGLTETGIEPTCPAKNSPAVTMTGLLPITYLGRLGFRLLRFRVALRLRYLLFARLLPSCRSPTKVLHRFGNLRQRR